MNILFTGHRGFLGKELIPSLSNNYKIITYDGDLCDYGKLEYFVEQNCITSIIHAAAKVGSRIKQDTVNDLTENLRIALNVSRLGIPVLSFCSGKIYGYQESIDDVSEEDIGRKYPDDFYGQAKFLIHELFKSDNNTKFLRLFNAFGFHETSEKFIRSNIKRYLTKQPMVIHQNIVFDFFYSQDILYALNYQLLENNLPKDVNLVYPEKLTLQEVCNLINELDNHKVAIEIENSMRGKNYFGDGSKLASLNLPLMGLKSGLKEVYRKMAEGL